MPSQDRLEEELDMVLTLPVTGNTGDRSADTIDAGGVLTELSGVLVRDGARGTRI